MCLNFDYEVGKNGDFDVVPPVGISFENYNSMMNPKTNPGSSEQKIVYNAR
ncbi:MAG: hypothetical protein WA139_01440 [Candidatus Aenigmatarchaeota archaeon]